MAHVEECRRKAEAVTRKRLPFDDDVLQYLLKVAPVSDSQELLDLLGDFCPDWKLEGRATLASVLRDCGPAPNHDEDAGGISFVATSEPSFGPGTSSQRAPEVDETADRMLAQMLQEQDDEEAETALNQGQQNHARTAKKQKKGFRPLNINYTVGRNAGTPAFGTAAPSSLADLLRTRRQQEQRAGDLQPENFGPPAARTATPWAPVPQDNETGMTWAERAQLAAERNAARAAEEAQQAQAQQAAANAMNLKLRTANGTEYRIIADRSETIGDVKARVAKQHHIPLEQQRILHLGRELPDTQQLRSANIPDGQPLQLALRNPSNAPQQPWPPQSRVPSQTAASPPQMKHGEERMMVRLRFPGGNVAALEGVSSSDTVRALKQQVQMEHGIRHDHMSLSFFGSPLADDWSLADSGVANSAILDVALITPKGNSLPETIRQAPTPQGTFPELRSTTGKKRAGGPQSDQHSGLQTTSHGRVMTEAEALEVALAASRSEAGGNASSGPSPVDDDSGDDEAEGNSIGETTDFMIDVSTKDAQVSSLVDHAKSVASEYFPMDLISRVSKRSGIRLTFIVQRCKKPKKVLGYMVYRFRASTVYLLQLAIASDQRNKGFTQHALKWMVQYTKKSHTEAIVTCCRPDDMKVYEKLGFRRGDAKALEVDDIWEDSSADGLVCMEYKSRKGNKDVKQPSSGPSRPDFEPPPALNAGRQASAATTSQMSRGELVRKLFVLLDVDGDQRLNVQEMQVFAQKTGFDGSKEEWESEFQILLATAKPSQDSVDLALLTKLVNDESDEGCYCTDSELQQMVTELQADANARAPKQSVDRQLPRRELIAAVFHALDMDSDGKLSQSEMKPFAAGTGFDGSDADWAEEYRLILSQYPETRSTGNMIALPLFERLVNDESDDGCYCTDDDLRKMLPDLQKAHPSAGAKVSAQDDNQDKRQRLVLDVFNACDFDGDGQLSLKEMRHFAGFTGFEGSDDEWAQEYGMLCSSYAGKKSSIDFALFLKLVNDESDDGCYCTDDELRDMLEKLLKMSSKEQEVQEAGARQGSASQVLVEKLRETDCVDNTSLGNAVEQSSPRAQLIREVFEACDENSDGCLSSKEMRVFAAFIGFQGSDQEWAEEFKMLCSQFAGTMSYIDFTLFQQLVDDQSDDGCYCTDEELQDMIQSLSKKSAGAQAKERAELEAKRKAVEEQQRADAEAKRKQAEDSIRIAEQAKLKAAEDKRQAELEANKKAAEEALAARGRAAAPAQESEREKLIRTVFESCDLDGDGRLNCAEMKTFAQKTGFDGGDDEWVTEYKLLSSQFSQTAVGIDLVHFRQLVEDDSDEGCYCTDDELRIMVNDLRQSREVAPHSSATSLECHEEDLPAFGQPAVNSSSSIDAPDGRQAKILAVFKALDTHNVGYLSSKEMRQFANFSGFDGGDEEWASEYELLCSHGGQSKSVIDFSFFQALVEDESDEGCYLTDDELDQIQNTLQPTNQCQRTEVTMQSAMSQSEDFTDGTRPIEEEELDAGVNPSELGHISESASSHAELIRAVFTACDADCDGRLSASEMLRFARATGFDGSEKEWEEEYQMLCSQYKGNRSYIDLTFFQQLVEDDSDDGCYCTDDELRQINEAFQACNIDNNRRPSSTENVHPEPALPAAAHPVSQPASPAAAHPVSQPVSAAVSRIDLARAVFRACDADGDGHLNCQEMRSFAGRTGFEGSDEEWASEYEHLLSESNADAQMGVSIDLFLQLVEDESDNGCYCTDEELRDMLHELFSDVRARAASEMQAVVAHAAPPSQRTEQLWQLFKALDVDGDGRLSAPEMRRFAGAIGFEGDDASWQEEFLRLFADDSGDPKEGLGLPLFMRLVEDTSEDGCYCDDDELKSLLDELQAEQQEVAAVAGELFVALQHNGSGAVTYDDFRSFAAAAGSTIGKDLLPWVQHAWFSLAGSSGISGGASERYSADGPPTSVDQETLGRLLCSLLRAAPGLLTPGRLRVINIRPQGSLGSNAGPSRPPPGLSPLLSPLGSSSLQVPPDDGEWHLAGNGSQSADQRDSSDPWNSWKDSKGSAHKSGTPWVPALDSASRRSAPSTAPAHAKRPNVKGGADSGAAHPAEADDWWSSKDEWQHEEVHEWGKDDDWWASGDGNDWWWAKDSDHWSQAAPTQSRKGNRKGSGRGASGYGRNGKDSDAWWSSR